MGSLYIFAQASGEGGTTVHSPLQKLWQIDNMICSVHTHIYIYICALTLSFWRHVACFPRSEVCLKLRAASSFQPSRSPFCKRPPKPVNPKPQTGSGPLLALPGLLAGLDVRAHRATGIQRSFTDPSNFRSKLRGFGFRAQES